MSSYYSGSGSGSASASTAASSYSAGGYYTSGTSSGPAVNGVEVVRKGGGNASASSMSADVRSTVSDLGLDADRVDLWRETFRRFDTDKSGSIDRQELQTVMDSLGKPVSAADVQEMLVMADTNLDGTVDFREFAVMMTNLDSVESRVIVEAFKVLTDGRETLDAQHLRNVLERFGRKVSEKEARTMLGRSHGFTVQDFARKIGFRGHLKTDFSSSSSVSGTTTYSQSPPTDEAGPAESEGALAEGEFALEVRAFYLREKHLIKVNSRSTLSDLREAISVKTSHPAKDIRVYYRGQPLATDERTLEEYRMRVNSTVYFIFLNRLRLDTDLAFDTNGAPRIVNIYHHFRRAGLLKVDDALRIVKAATALMQQEANLIEVGDPATIVGDIHGQFFDMEEILSLGGQMSDNHNHVFLGDYVDRGYFSCEVILYLLAAKVAYPNNVYLLRGNHESRKTTKKYGTQEEFQHKYNAKLYKELMKCFDAMPIYGIVNSRGHRIMVMHGGISHRIKTLDDINAVNRFIEPPNNSILKDCLWCDPYKDCEADTNWPLSWNLKKLDPIEATDPGSDSGHFHSSSRGKLLSTFGHPALLHFLEQNDLLTIMRGHEQKQSGFQMYKHGPRYNFPGCFTVFSAPNYTDKSMNLGAVIVVRKGRLEVKTFSFRLHPVYRDFTDPKGAFRRDLHKEDFVAYAYYLHPKTLYKTPLIKLHSQYKEGFVARRALGSKTEEDSDAENHVSHWNFVHMNLMGILKLSKDRKVRRLLQRKTEAMHNWFDSVDHFSEALASESEYEKDIVEEEDRSRPCQQCSVM